MKIVSINVGKPQTMEWNGRSVRTGIFKTPVSGPVQLDELGLAGDGQADLVHHGGRTKAVNGYFHVHYPYWESLFGHELPPGSFGENLTLSGAAETDICIGDVYRVGDVTLEVTQPRGPCFKLAARHGMDDMVQRVLATGYTGLYFRVATPGTLCAGECLELVFRPPAALTIAEANRQRMEQKSS